jgi:hypothetical protein
LIANPGVRIGRITSRRLALFAGLASGALLSVLVCLGTYSAYDGLVRKHTRANQLWQQRQPQHYLYTFRYRSFMANLNWLVEVENSAITHVYDSDSGLEHLTWADYRSANVPGLQVSRTRVDIDDIFRAIQNASQLSTTPKGFFSRTNPALYQSLAKRGWLPSGWEGCRPALPQVQYDPDFGYPRQVKLFGNPCSTTNEEAQAASIQIEIIQILR